MRGTMRRWLNDQWRRLHGWRVRKDETGAKWWITPGRSTRRSSWVSSLLWIVAGLVLWLLYALAVGNDFVPTRAEFDQWIEQTFHLGEDR